MTRQATPTDYTVDVDGIGAFRFGRRAMGDHIRIHVEYARLTEGVEPTPWLNFVCTWLSTLRVLTVNAPDGWDLDALDPLDDAIYADLFKVHAALSEKERSFRRKHGKDRALGGEDASGDDRVLVPQAVSPDGP